MNYGYSVKTFMYGPGKRNYNSINAKLLKAYETENWADLRCFADWAVEVEEEQFIITRVERIMDCHEGGEPFSTWKVTAMIEGDPIGEWLGSSEDGQWGVYLKKREETLDHLSPHVVFGGEG